MTAWQAPNQSFIIDKGILVPGTKLIIFGKFQTWKSMLAIHTAFTIAQGKDWFGFRTYKSVAYLLQVENPQAQFQKRVVKYMAGNSIPLSIGGVYLCTEPYIKLDRGFGLAEMDKELQRCKPGVVILDPIYKIVSGRITDEYDMRQFMDRMDLLMDKYKFALILIHHDRKGQIFEGKVISMGADDMFGTSIFIDWVDSSIRTETTEIDGEVRLTFEKLRHADEELQPILVKVDRATLRFTKE